MKAVYVAEPHSLEIREMPMPKPGQGEALVRVRAGGICGSDMHIHHGTNPLAKYPRIIGTSSRERSGPSGRGAGLQHRGPRGGGPGHKLRHMLRVFHRPLNVCENLEVFGVHRHGGFAEYVALPVKNLHKIPSSWSFEKGSLGEPFTIAANVLSRTECSGADRLLIMGAGPIGR